MNTPQIPLAPNDRHLRFTQQVGWGNSASRVSHPHPGVRGESSDGHRKRRQVDCTSASQASAGTMSPSTPTAKASPVAKPSIEKQTRVIHLSERDCKVISKGHGYKEG